VVIVRLRTRMSGSVPKSRARTGEGSAQAESRKGVPCRGWQANARRLPLSSVCSNVSRGSDRLSRADSVWTTSAIRGLPRQPGVNVGRSQFSRLARLRGWPADGTG
jgi:hypothetical protein